MDQEGKETLGAILWELMLALIRLEAVAELGARSMKVQGLEDEAGKLWDLYVVANDWLEEVMAWIANLVRGQEGGDE